MALELHVSESALAQACIEYVQSRLFTICVPTGTALISVDHLDAVPGSVKFSDVEGGIEVRSSIAIYLVAQADLLSHVNATPSGAKTPAAHDEVIITLGIVDGNLTIIDASSGTPKGVPGPVAALIKAKVDGALEPLNGTTLFDLNPIINALEAAVPADPDMGRAGGVIALRFGASGPVASHLGAGQAWGVFLDADQTVDLVRSKIPSSFPVPVSVRWVANGPTPFIHATANIELSVLGIGVAGVDATVDIGPSFIPPSTLRLTGQWDVDLSGIIGPLEGIVTKFVRGEIRQMLPDAHHNGQSLYYDFALPVIPALLGARPQWATMTSTAAGVTLGGPVLPAPTADRRTLEAMINEFGRPSWWGHCRASARSGSGNPPRWFSPSDPQVRVRAGVSFTAAGKLCGSEVLDPNSGLPMLSSIDGVDFNLTVGVARMITDPVRVIVRTARGVRFFNLGVPTIRLTRDGGLDVALYWFDDCLRLSGPLLKLALGEQLTIDDFRPPPLEDPNWITWFGAAQGFNIHLVTLDQLDPGEAVRVMGPGLEIRATADGFGVLSLPAPVAVADTMREVVVERPSGQVFADGVRVSTVELTWLAEVGPAAEAAINYVDGTVVVSRIVDDELITEAFLPDNDGALQLVDAPKDLNPQPLPPLNPDVAQLAAELGIDDVRSAYFVPGNHRGAQVAMIGRGHGSAILVSVGETPQVFGEYAGPPLGLNINGDFAIARSAEVVHLFAVGRPRGVALKDTSRSRRA